MKNVFIGIDHPAIAAEDVEKLTQWYCEVLGYKVLVRTEQPVYIIAAPDGTYLEIMPKDSQQRPKRSINTAGFSHLALRVSNMDAAIAALNSKKVAWLTDEFIAAGGGRMRNFADPEGNVLQIVQREPQTTIR